MANRRKGKRIATPDGVRVFGKNANREGSVYRHRQRSVGRDLVGARGEAAPCGVGEDATGGDRTTGPPPGAGRPCIRRTAHGRQPRQLVAPERSQARGSTFHMGQGRGSGAQDQGDARRAACDAARLPRGHGVAGGPRADARTADRAAPPADPRTDRRRGREDGDAGRQPAWPSSLTRPGPCSTRSASTALPPQWRSSSSGCATGPTRCPAAKSSGPPSRVRSCASPHCCSPTSQPAHWTATGAQV
jgi:hypothetical protein